jgi:hypothetical protein
VAAVACLAGCGGDHANGPTVSADELVLAANQTANHGPLGIEEQVSGSLSDNERIALSVSGAADARSGRARYRIAATRSGDGPVSDMAKNMLAANGDFYADGTEYHYRNPRVARNLGDKRAWAAIEISDPRIGQARGSEGPGLGLSRPAKPLDWLTTAVGRATVIGRERVAGVTTTHYEGTAELENLISAGAPEDTHRMVDQLRLATGKSTFPVEAWIDARGYVRRMAGRLDIGKIHLDVTIDVDPRKARKPKPPPRRFVTDVTRYVPTGG